MSELSDLIAGIDKIRLRQSREIGHIIDRRAGNVGDDGYEFAVEIAAAVLDCAPADIEEMSGSLGDLRDGMTRILALAGFRPGEAQPVASPLSGDSGASGVPSPPAAATRRKR
jgi:hypothetical protein